MLASSMLAGGKLSFLSWGAGARFEVPCKFDRGALRVGYLRSYEGMGSVEVSVWRRSGTFSLASRLARDGSKQDRPLVSRVINSTWETHMSIYGSTDVFLPYGHVPATLQVALRRVDEGMFALYTLSSF